MANLNLLPWRENTITFQNRIFFSISGVAAFLCVVIVFLLSLYVGKQAIEEEASIKKIRTEANKLEDLISEIQGLQEQKKLLLARREVIQSLQASRPFIVKVFDGIAKAVPNGLYLSSISRVGNRLTIVGFSESNSRISAFMRELQQMDWVAEAATLGEIKTASGGDEEAGSGGQETEFTLSVTLRYQ